MELGLTHKDIEIVDEIIKQNNLSTKFVEIFSNTSIQCRYLGLPIFIEAEPCSNQDC